MSAISSERLCLLEQRSREHGGSGNSWDGYAIVLRYLDGAIQRLPSLEEMQACDGDGIDFLFGTELEHLASMVVEIFPVEGFDELAMYLKKPAR